MLACTNGASLGDVCRGTRRTSAHRKEQICGRHVARLEFEAPQRLARVPQPRTLLAAGRCLEADVHRYGCTQ